MDPKTAAFSSNNGGHGSPTCSICGETLLGQGYRFTVKLQCGHEFHLDCIDSAFNAKGTMECPNCPNMEKGDHCLYGNPNYPSSFSSELDFTEENDEFFRRNFPELMFDGFSEDGDPMGGNANFHGSYSNGFYNIDDREMGYYQPSFYPNLEFDHSWTQTTTQLFDDDYSIIMGSIDYHGFYEQLQQQPRAMDDRCASATLFLKNLLGIGSVATNEPCNDQPPVMMDDPCASATLTFRSLLGIESVEACNQHQQSPSMMNEVCNQQQSPSTMDPYASATLALRNLLGIM